jgi:hypothetical protein
MFGKLFQLLIDFLLLHLLLRYCNPLDYLWDIIYSSVGNWPLNIKPDNELAPVFKTIILCSRQNHKMHNIQPTPTFLINVGSYVISSLVISFFCNTFLFIVSNREK